MEICLVIRRILFPLFAVVFHFNCFAETSVKSMPLNLPQGVTNISHDVYDLHMTILIICAVIGVLVFSVMFWAMLFHRKSRGAKAANFHENIKVEVIWTVIPFVILIGMAIPATRTLIAMEDSTEPDITILVTGSQWKWHYKYLDHDIEFYSVLATAQQAISGTWTKSDNYLLEVDKPLVLPINKKIRFLMTSDDVIHSWWVPDFAVKKDANPGFINEAWTKINSPGIYRGQCAELCGKDHGFMPVVVIAKPEADFDLWLEQKVTEQQQALAEEQRLLAMNMSKDELMVEGEQVYLAHCAACHQPNGAGLPGIFPSMIGSAITTGSIEEHINIVANGKSGTAMQGFAKQLSKKELAAVITYERNAWGNNTDDLIQVKDIHQFLQSSF
jgi:cytochrome c oxidase subunit 2